MYNCSNDAYLQAEQYLLRTLKLNDSVPPALSVSKRLISESFLATGRLDSEYYQPQYDKYLEHLHSTDNLLSLCSLHDKNCPPRQNTYYKYIELSNIGFAGDILDVEMVLGNDLPSRARRLVKSGQVIVSSVEGSLQNCALITGEYDGAICSTGFYVVSSDRLNPETLLVLFKSWPIQALMKQRCSGTILTAISKDEFQRMPLPLINGDVQQQVAALIQQSFDLRGRSKQLLEYAKHSVEIAIEQDEETAIEWLNTKGVES